MSSMKRLLWSKLNCHVLIGLQSKAKQDIWKQDIQGILEEHLKTELRKGWNCLLIKEKGLKNEIIKNTEA